MKIYDNSGREIKSLVNEIKNPGNYFVNFDGSSFASGIYYYKIVAGKFEAIRKMILIK
ncbi:MAG: T9SS type A sorting domain-containing protein [Ignavibacteria bacterium]|nr:T9SS type A sorting domain-containing protein [Ignavibacteria bacterium]